MSVEEVYLSFSTDYLNFTSEGGKKIIEIYGNADWKIVSDIPQWITIHTTETSVDKSILLFELSKNNSDSVRTCQIYFEYPSGGNVINIAQTGNEILRFSDDNHIDLNENDTCLTLTITKNVPYLVDIENDCKDWISIEGQDSSDENQIAKEFTDKEISLNILGNYSGMERDATIVIYNKKYNLSDTISISQKSGKKIYYTDGEFILLQKAIKGKSVNLFIIGDGFTAENLEIGGVYENVMKQSMEYFFSVEPYSSYRDYFTVYSVIAESETNLVGSGKTKFQTKFGSGTAISCNDDIVFEYAGKVNNISGDNPITIIMPLNIDKYAGTAYLYANGNTIALCPMSKELPPYDFEGIIHHEAGGHGFGLLCDEYIYYDKKMPDSRKQEIQEWQKLGFYHNLDFTDNLEEIRWKDFIGYPQYINVGAFEGGYEYQYGVWRSEENSCMNNNIPYYNVQSRWSIVKRIMDLSDTEISLSEFIKNDKIYKPAYNIFPSSSTKDFIPLGKNVLIK